MFKAPPPKELPKVLAPAGTQVARLYILADIGTQTIMWSGQEKVKRQVVFTWELPSKLHVFKEEKGPEPFVVSKKMTLSMHEQSQMKPMVEAWIGKTFAEGEAENFDIATLVGKPCLLTITHDKKGDKTYANIASVAAPIDGMNVPPPINKPVIYQIEDREGGNFKLLPEWLQAQVRKSLEFTGKFPAKANEEDDYADSEAKSQSEKQPF